MTRAEREFASWCEADAARRAELRAELERFQRNRPSCGERPLRVAVLEAAERVVRHADGRPRVHGLVEPSAGGGGSFCGFGSARELALALAMRAELVRRFAALSARERERLGGSFDRWLSERVASRGGSET